MTDEEYQAHRKKLFAERSRVIKAAYDRKMERLKRQAAMKGTGKIDEQDINRSYFVFFLLFFFIVCPCFRYRR